MKKNIAKLLVLAMLLTMVPFAAAAPAASTGSGGGGDTAKPVVVPEYHLISDVKVAGVAATKIDHSAPTNNANSPYGISVDVASNKVGEQTELIITLIKDTGVTAGYFKTLPEATSPISSEDTSKMTLSDTQNTLSLSAKLDLSGVKAGETRYFGLALQVGYNPPVYYRLTVNVVQASSEPAPELTLSISDTSKTILKGSIFKLTVTSNGDNVEWETDNEEVAYFPVLEDNGQEYDYEEIDEETFLLPIFGNTPGKATITITAIREDGTKKVATCVVTVEDNAVAGVGEIYGTSVPNATANTAGKSDNVAGAMTAAASAINEKLEEVAAENLDLVAKTIVTENKPSQKELDDAKAALDAKLTDEDRAKPLRTIIVPVINIKVSDATATDSAISSLVFDITATAEIIVTRVQEADEEPEGIPAEKTALAKSVPLNDTKETVTITLPLPASLQNMTSPVVKHRKTDNGPILWHKAQPVPGVGIRFQNSQGFSTFTVENAAGAAVIGEKYFETLQKAIDAAKANDTIIVLDDGLSAEKVGKALTFQPAEGVTGLSVTAASGYTVNRNQDGSITVREASSSSGGGGGGSSKPSIKPGEKPVKPGTTVPGGGVAGFNDVAVGAWYADSVKYVVEKGLFGGVGNGNFAPEANMTRAMMWTVLARYMGVNTDTGSNWYEAARAWAIEKGISDGTMADGNVTREQFVTMLWRLSGEPAVDSAADFTDGGKVSDYAKTAVAWAVSQGIVNGYSDGSFKPQGSATRAEVAKMLTVFCQSAEADA